MNPLEAQILRYIGEHPRASDTLEGITQWWISDQLGCTPAQVRQVLERLVSCGFLSVVFDSADRPHYKRATTLA